MCGECHSVEWDTQESTRSRPRLHVDRVAPSDQARRRTTRRGARRARRRHPLRRQPARRSSPTWWRTAWRSPLSIETVDDVVLPQFRPVRVAMSALSRDTAIVGIGQTEFSKHSGRSELQLAGEAVAAAVADAGLTPRDIDGAVTFAMDVNDELSVIRCAGIPELRFTARTRGGGGGACATVQLASAAVASGAADAVVVYRAFNERSGRRFGQPLAENNQVAGDAAGLELVPAVRARHAGQGVRALVPALHAHLRRHQRGLRPLPGRRPQARGDQPGRVLLPAAPHARGPPGVALDRRAHPAQARLLPGERRRRRAWWSRAWTAPATSRTRPCASPPRPRRTCATARRCSTTTSATAPRSRKRRGWAGSSTRRPASRPTTSTWR